MKGLVATTIVGVVVGTFVPAVLAQESEEIDPLTGEFSFTVSAESEPEDTADDSPSPAFRAAALSESTLIGIEWVTGKIYAISPTDASLTFLGTVTLNTSFQASLEFGPNGFLYTFTAGNNPAFYRVDPFTLDVTFIGSLGIGFVFEGGLAFAPDGTAYGMNDGDSFNPALFTVDPVTGSATVVGVIGFHHDINGLAWRSDMMLVGLDRVTNALLAIDPQTAQSETIAPMPGIVGALGGMAVLDGTAYFVTGGPLTGSNELYSVDLFTGDTVFIGSLSPTIAGAGISGLAAGLAAMPPPNQPPLALCMAVTVSAGFDCTADASIDAGSFDPDGDPITLSQAPPGPYGLGDTLVTLTVTDDRGASGSCMATVTVQDTTPPQLSVVLAPDTLWPPNHHMVDVEATVTASDNCGTPAIALASLTSNEADDALGRGDGKTTGDIQLGTDDFHFRLRAERAGGGSGRIYTAVYTATDSSGNATSEAGFVVVPHDQGGVVDPVVIALEQNASGTLVSWPAVSGAESYDVIRGELNNVVETGVVINLGTVVCIEANSTDENTLGWEDGELPEPGQTFFYVVEYYDGISSTYGTESAGKPRAPGSGDCQ